MLTIGTGLAVAPALAPALTPAGGPTLVSAAARTECPATRTIRMTEANIKSGMSASATKADVASVMRVKPDFVAYNEVPYRADSLLAPSGYDIWRSPGRYIGANAVVWRTDRWRPIARGTIYVSNVPGTVKGQTSEWGIRYANWATLRSVDGCQTVSVVSYHVAPRNRITENLLIPSVRRLGALTEFLAEAGPVILGGDMNAHYNGARYPRAELTAGGMTPTFDLTGKKLVTHDGGGIIDYILVNRKEQFRVTKQVTHELRSDHKLLIADLQLNRTVKVPAVPETIMRGHVVNVPESPLMIGRHSVVRRLADAVRRTPAGEVLRYSTEELGDARLRRVLADAYRRGVHVNFVTTNAEPNRNERALMALLGTSRSKPSWALARSQAKAASLNMPPTVLLASVSSGKPYVRMDVDKTSDPQQMALHTARAQMFTELGDYSARKRTFGLLIR